MTTVVAHSAYRPATYPTHPRGSNARVLLTSVFGPYARDDEYGSRSLNPMELYHNQVTRVQRAFSLRMFHRSWGLMLIQSNITAPCTLLDFPTLDRLIEELRTEPYDIIGIGAIIPNLSKVRHMCEIIRRHQPQATLVIGGHVANYPDLDRLVDADHIVRGEGVEWMRRYLGEDTAAPIRHPRISSGIGSRTMGVAMREKQGDVAAVLLPSVGCPMGCNFCATSAMFGGKGACIHFYETGDELFDVMCGLEADMKVRSFFVMDENFLLHRKRALRLLELMQQHHKAWSLYIFASANVLRAYSIEQIVALGISWVWMGLEGKDAAYTKLRDADTRTLVRTLQSHGIRVLGSSIIGMENHTLDNIDDAIDYAVEHDTEFHQFMLYTPIPGTPLYKEHQQAGTMLPPDEYVESDIHGQLMFNFRHPHIPRGEEGRLILRAFQRDFEVNGPSVVRIARTVLQGWKRYKNHPDRRIRSRFAWEARDLAVTYAGALWAAREHFRHANAALSARIAHSLDEIKKEFGWKARLAAPLVGRYLLKMLAREEQRLANHWTYEPPTFYEHNAHVRLGAAT
ncbi:MAG: cobalamin-dependent protein [Phycisphaerales bacterium]|nr:cobalamin-dependent protein [Phycisphaerales bacterium]